MIYTLPREWDILSAIATANELIALANNSEDKLILDFRNSEFVRPSGIVLIAETIKRIKPICSNRGIKLKAYFPTQATYAYSNGFSYLQHSGFFRHVGINIGRDINQPPGRNYVAIRSIYRDELRNQGIRIQEAIKLESENLSEIVSPAAEPTHDQTMIAYSLREIIRNVFEHSHANSCAVIAQRYDRQCTVEIGVIDSGRGILESLAESHSLESPDHALATAIEPGISRVMTIDDNEWGNSGFGLYNLAETARRCNGEFIIGSSGRYLRLNGNETQSGFLDSQGTIVHVKLNLKNAEYYPNIHRAIVLDGENMYFTRNGVQKKASKSSTLLF